MVAVLQACLPDMAMRLMRRFRRKVAPMSRGRHRVTACGVVYLLTTRAGVPDFVHVPFVWWTNNPICNNRADAVKGPNFGTHCSPSKPHVLLNCFVCGMLCMEAFAYRPEPWKKSCSHGTKSCMTNRGSYLKTSDRNGSQGCSRLIVFM